MQEVKLRAKRFSSPEAGQTRINSKQFALLGIENKGEIEIRNAATGKSIHVTAVPDCQIESEEIAVRPEECELLGIKEGEELMVQQPNEGLVEMTMKTLKNATEVIAEKVTKIKDSVTGEVHDIKEKAKEGAGSLKEKVKGTENEMKEKVEKGAGSLKEKAKGTENEMKEKAKEGAGSLKEKAKGTENEMGEKAEKGAGSLKEKAKGTEKSVKKRVSQTEEKGEQTLERSDIPKKKKKTERE